MPFIVQNARVRVPQTVPSPYYPGVYAWDSTGRVSVLPFICPCPNLHLQAAWGSLAWIRPGCLSALGSCLLAPFLPAGGRQDVDLPSISGFLPRHLPVYAVPGRRAKLEVPELWRARWALVHRGGCPWGVHRQRTQSRQTIEVRSRPGCHTGVGGVAAHGGANRGRC